MYLEFWYNVDKRFPPKLASWLSVTDRTPSCLSKTYKPNRHEMQRVFDKFDVNKDGKISGTDLKQHFESLMKKESMRDQVYKMVQAADFDGDKVINFTDFMKLHEKGISELEIRKAFRMYDLDEDGKISVDDLQKMFHRLGEKCSTSECESMIEKVDIDRDGKVDVEEFMIMMTKTLETLPV
ncbi:hypothetical protein AAC387_Pa11g1501 [Persea americana]